jgi:hypothetical protein
LLLLAIVGTGCRQPEDPARVALRARLTLDARLSNQELDGLRREVIRTIAGKRFSIKEGTATRTASLEQQTLLFEMLSEPAGMYDEGLRHDGGAALRVLNAPGRSSNAEIEAAQRLLIDIETLMPRRYQFEYAVSGPDDFAVDLAVEE